MIFFSESNNVIIKKQKLAEYIDSFLVLLKENSHFKPSPKLVQIVTLNSISDGNTDFPCRFTTLQKYKKGSYIRLVKWELDVNNF
jgi:hypothetical protein